MAYNGKLLVYNRASLLTMVLGVFLLLVGVFACNWNFLAQSGKVCLSTSTDCKKESSTVATNATIDKTASPLDKNGVLGTGTAT